MSWNPHKPSHGFLGKVHSLSSGTEMLHDLGNATSNEQEESGAIHVHLPYIVLLALRMYQFISYEFCKQRLTESAFPSFQPSSGFLTLQGMQLAFRGVGCCLALRLEAGTRGKSWNCGASAPRCWAYNFLLAPFFSVIKVTP